MNKPTVIGTRGSQLALWQTEWIKTRLQQRYPSHRFETLPVKTAGDKILDVPLAEIGDKGLFTKELDNALLRGEIDLAVHSLKDLPTTLPEGIVISAITERWDPRDALISSGELTLEKLPRGAAVATGSLRRRAQLLHYRRDLQIVELRGNLNTRFRKFESCGWDAMVLAVAGVERLGWGERISERISTDVILPAVGQGSFAVVCRAEDSAAIRMCSSLNDARAATAAAAERSLLSALQGGCQVPIGALAVVKGESLQLSACIASLDGRRLFRSSRSGKASHAEAIGAELAGELLGMGGREVLDEIIQNTRREHAR